MVGDFNYKQSLACKMFQKKGWHEFEVVELRELCLALEKDTKIKLYREAKRLKSVMFKWLTDNWELLAPSIEKFRPLFES
jgi:hypothetical protein